MRTNIIVRSLSVLLFIISLIAGSAFVYAFAHAQEGMGTIPEGTTAEGIDLSGMTPEEARAELADHAQDASTVSVTLQVGEVEYPVSLDSSVSYDVDSVVDAAMAPLEGQTAADRIEHQVKKRLGRAEVEPRDLTSPTRSTSSPSVLRSSGSPLRPQPLPWTPPVPSRAIRS